jgi:2-keto-3-deoxy-6-phosphogluconate aldolase
MTSKEILAFITEVGIVPIVRTSSAEGAIQAVEAIYNGGIRAAEVTMTVPGAIRVLEKLADRFGDKIVLGDGARLHVGRRRVLRYAQPAAFHHRDGEALLESHLPRRADTD